MAWATIASRSVMAPRSIQSAGIGLPADELSCTVPEPQVGLAPM